VEGGTLPRLSGPAESLTIHRVTRFPSAAEQASFEGDVFVSMQLTAVFQRVPEGYIAFVEELPGANTQGATLDEARINLQEAVQLVLEANRQLSHESVRSEEVIREPLIIG
jgi:predicted RNase H-like HicB family nuclease